MRSYPEISIWELVSGTPCFGPHLILCGQNPLTAWYPGPDTSSLAVRFILILIGCAKESRVLTIYS
jgi:hypothetical protein